MTPGEEVGGGKNLSLSPQPLTRVDAQLPAAVTGSSLHLLRKALLPPLASHSYTPLPPRGVCVRACISLLHPTPTPGCVCVCMCVHLTPTPHSHPRVCVCVHVHLTPTPHSHPGGVCVCVCMCVHLNPTPHSHPGMCARVRARTSLLHPTPTLVCLCVGGL